MTKIATPKLNRIIPLAFLLLGLVVFLSPRSDVVERVVKRDLVEPGVVVPSGAGGTVAIPGNLGSISREEGISEKAGEGRDGISSFPGGEQESLWEAFSEARREVRAIPDSWAQREENLGFEYYATHPKQHLTARFGSEGVQLVSSERTYTAEDLENPHTTWSAQMRLVKFAGEVVQGWSRPEKSEEFGSRMEYRHGAELTEWYDNGAEGVEHGFTIAVRPGKLAAGEEVTFEVALDGLSVTEREDEALSFGDGEREVLSYSKLLVIDAEGSELPSAMKPSGDGFVLAYLDAGAVYPVTVDPLIVNEEAKINRADPNAAGDELGASVAISGDTVVVGAPKDDLDGTSSGSAYVFVRENDVWSRQQILTAADAAAGDEFGGAVGISGDLIVVGARRDDDGGPDAGSAYVFVRSGSTWTEQDKLVAADGMMGDGFGVSVGIDGSTIVVGASLDDDGAVLNIGSAYVFVSGISDWTQQDKLVADDAAVGDQMGYSVAISGDTIIAGAFGNDDDGGNSGSAYAFVRSGTSWSEQRKFTASDAAKADHFGWSVAISGERVVIGAFRDDDHGEDSGSAYVFVREGTKWLQDEKLTAEDIFDDSIDHRFGAAVGISGDSIVVGAERWQLDETAFGSAYIFLFFENEWIRVGQVIAEENARDDDNFGTSVAISDGLLVVGSSLNDNPTTDSGSAFVFAREGNIWSHDSALSHHDASNYDDLGSSVGISGDTAVIGVPGGDGAGRETGEAYVFVRSGATWEEQEKLLAVDGGANDLFGISVAISGDTISIGARGDRDRGIDSGSAYVFFRSEGVWNQQAKLEADDTDEGDLFGSSIAISGDTIVVGAAWAGLGDLNIGSAYVFVRSGSSWEQEAKLTAGDVEALKYFGVAVAVFGDSLVVGAFGDNEIEASSGAAYVFQRRNGRWLQEEKLKANDAGPNDLMGTSVAISADAIVVGASNSSAGASASGSAYIYSRSGGAWSQSSKITADVPMINDGFGVSAAISGDFLVIGSDAGRVYQFTRNGSHWSQEGIFLGDYPDRFFLFGASVAISGDTMIVGAAAESDGGNNSGSAYIYRVAQTSVRALQVFDHLGAVLNDGGFAPTLRGQLLGTEREFVFQLSNAGELDLDIQSISLGGANAGEFSLVLPDFSSPSDLSSGERIDFVIRFHPAGLSGFREAIVIITSNSSSDSVSSFSLSGIGLSASADEDGDGMTDWGEYSMRAFGFDWENSQPGLVSHYYEQASTTGLVNQSELGRVSGGVSLVAVDPASQTADLVIELQETTDLENFTPIDLEDANLSVDADGNIRYELDTGDGKKFYRAEWKGE